MAEAGGDGVAVEGREVNEEESEALKGSERGEMAEVFLEQGWVHQLPPGVREPQYTRVRGNTFWPGGDRITPTLEPVLSREGDVPEEAAPAPRDPGTGDERACSEVFRSVLEMVDDIVDDFLRENACHGGDSSRCDGACRGSDWGNK